MTLAHDNWCRPGFDPVILEDRAQMARQLVTIAPALAGRRVLITGAGGMLPSYLVLALGALNETTLRHDPCLIYALTRRPPRAELLTDDHVQWLIQDVCQPLPMDVFFDYAICGASAAAPRAYLADPVGTLTANALGLQHVLSRARQCHAQGIVFMSSGEIYGSPGPEDCPTPESYVAASDPLAPRACYVEGKRFGESLALAYVRQHGLGVKIVRPFQIFGPGLKLDDGRAFADFVAAAAEGKEIVLRSKGEALRSFCYLADATVAFLLTMVCGEPGAVYNIGSPGPEVTIAQLAHLVAEVSGTGSQVRFDLSDAQAGAGSPGRTCPDTNAIKQDLGWEPTTSLEEGLRRTLRWLAQKES